MLLLVFPDMLLLLLLVLPDSFCETHGLSLPPVLSPLLDMDFVTIATESLSQYLQPLVTVSWYPRYLPSTLDIFLPLSISPFHPRYLPSTLDISLPPSISPFHPRYLPSTLDISCYSCRLATVPVCWWRSCPTFVSAVQRSWNPRHSVRTTSPSLFLVWLSPCTSVLFCTALPRATRLQCRYFLSYEFSNNPVANFALHIVQVCICSFVH